jgi:hypothetical protein
MIQTAAVRFRASDFRYPYIKQSGLFGAVKKSLTIPHEDLFN